MGNEKQMQKAGDNSQQVQAEVVNVTNNYIMGIDEKRVREVCSEVAVEAIKSCTQEATETALARIENFTTTLVPRIEKIEKDFHSFSEPSFQFLLQSAQKTAACTEREADYEMLSELLVHRIEKKTERKTTASIEKAIDIVNQIDDDALCGLTLVHIIDIITPLTGDILEGLKVMNDLFSSLLYIELPNGNEWIEHLDMLNAIRIANVGKFKKMEEFYPQILDGYSCVGIEKDSENHKKAIEILHSAELPEELLVEHELHQGYVRLNFRNRKTMLGTKLLRVFPDKQTVLFKEIDEQEDIALKSIWDLYSKDNEKATIVKNMFIQKWDEFEVLKKIHTWWNEIPNAFAITPVGKVLTHANAQRCNKMIPDMNK